MQLVVELGLCFDAKDLQREKEKDSVNKMKLNVYKFLITLILSRDQVVCGRQKGSNAISTF